MNLYYVDVKLFDTFEETSSHRGCKRAIMACQEEKGSLGGNGGMIDL